MDLYCVISFIETLAALRGNAASLRNFHKSKVARKAIELIQQDRSRKELYEQHARRSLV